ncbi:hypothetical protein PIB30_064551 [Stylosanthes scabra]|uniref:Uncharacterized protein n=1 Tax=Stylosanthes scabra TaxID=79078 RepID=A0ABU6YMA6_9FABA|nr:hypothetical protein [Stylosanthes scabra]
MHVVQHSAAAFYSVAFVLSDLRRCSSTFSTSTLSAAFYSVTFVLSDLRRRSSTFSTSTTTPLSRASYSSRSSSSSRASNLLQVPGSFLSELLLLLSSK